MVGCRSINRSLTACCDHVATMAPGTPLREGFERILRGRTGALVVLGNTREVHQLCTGGFALDVPFTPTALRELAKMDGAIVLDAGGTGSSGPGVQLMPDAGICTVETGTRHRTADRVARQTGVPVVTDLGLDVHDLAVRRRHRRVRRALRADPLPGEPGAADPGALPQPAQRADQPAVGAGGARPGDREGRRCGRAADSRWSAGWSSSSRGTCSSSAPTVGC